MKHMKKTSRNGVIALNIVLVAILTVISLVPESEATFTAEQRYIALPSTASGVTTGIVYLMNTAQRELVAISWDHNKNSIVTLGYRNLSSDASSALNQ
jgi:hypothetical protein